MPENTIAPVIPESEIELKAVRAQGAGGQNINKVSNAMQLRFDIRASSLPDALKQRLLLHHADVIVIKAQRHRSLELNRADALARLQALVAAAAYVPKKRKPTRPTRASRERRREAKTQRARLKTQRAKVAW